MDTPFLLYGSYGYTGALIADLAVKQSMRPVLSGRDPQKLKAQAAQLGLDYIAISIDDQAALDKAISGTPLVLNCAGPFKQTYQPIVQACLRAHRHYLDITGEILVFEALAARDTEARQSGVMFLPGAGFDVTPSDCLAAHLKRRLPQANHLTLAIQSLGGGLSRGTALTGIEGLADQGVIRRDGKLVKVPLSWKTRQFDFGNGLKTAMSFPWADVCTAFYSTGIPNIDEYLVRPISFVRMVQWFHPLIGLTARPFVKRWLKTIVMNLPPGPSDEARERGQSRIWGEVGDPQGHKVVSRLLTPEAYALTAQTALAAVRKILRGDFKPGFQTPSLAFGADFILEIQGVKREDL